MHSGVFLRSDVIAQPIGLYSPTLVRDGNYGAEGGQHHNLRRQPLHKIEQAWLDKWIYNFRPVHFSQIIYKFGVPTIHTGPDRSQTAQVSPPEKKPNKAVEHALLELGKDTLSDLIFGTDP